MDNLDFNFFCLECQQSQEYRRSNCFTKYRIRRFSRGEYIAYKGDEVHELSMLVRGSITVSVPLSSGVVVRSTRHDAPYPIGAMALFAEENRYRVDIVAEDDVEVISVRREHIEQQIVECRDFMRRFIAYPVTKFDIFSEHITVLTQRGIRSKLAYYIFRTSSGESYHFGRSIQSLADYLSVERPSLSRMIATLVKEGVISYHEGRGEILNRTALREMVE